MGCNRITTILSSGLKPRSFYPKSSFFSLASHDRYRTESAKATLTAVVPMIVLTMTRLDSLDIERYLLTLCLKRASELLASVAA